MSVINDPVQATCPAPHAEHERVLLGHGSGGQLSARLLHDVIVPGLGAAAADLSLDDAAVLDLEPFIAPADGSAGGGAGSEDLRSGSVVVTTDSFVVDPLEFPGGDIGALAVHGTVNDLAMRGAQPLALTVALIVEEGFALADLRRLVASVGRAAARAGVKHVVRLSALTVTDADADDLITRWHRDCERRLEASGLLWTFVRPRSFMSNTLGWARSLVDGVVRAPFGSARVACVDPRDVAEVAVRALTEPGHEGRAYSVTGPAAISSAVVAFPRRKFDMRMKKLNAVSDLAPKS